MAYAHTQYEVLLTNAAAISSTGDKASWFPGYVRHVLRAWFAVVTTALAAETGKLDMDKQITAGSATGRIADFVSPLNLPASTAQGKVIYKDGLQSNVSPGEALVYNVTDAMATGNVSVGIFVEPNWEVPANNTNMALTT